MVVVLDLHRFINNYTGCFASVAIRFWRQHVDINAMSIKNLRTYAARTTTMRRAASRLYGIVYGLIITRAHTTQQLRAALVVGADELHYEAFRSGYDPVDL